MYPGSAKGLEPHHDPINYLDWYQKNIPQDLKESLFPEEQEDDQMTIEYGQEEPQELVVLTGPAVTLNNPGTLKNIVTTNFYE